MTNYSSTYLQCNVVCAEVFYTFDTFHGSSVAPVLFAKEGEVVILVVHCKITIARMKDTVGGVTSTGYNAHVLTINGTQSCCILLAHPLNGGQQEHILLIMHSWGHIASTSFGNIANTSTSVCVGQSKLVPVAVKAD